MCKIFFKISDFFVQYFWILVEFVCALVVVILLVAVIVGFFVGLGFSEGMSNKTRAGSFESQTANHWVGGSYYKRIPAKNLTMLNFDTPSINAGCGGIDIHGGSFSAVRSKELVNLAKNVVKQAPYFAVQLGLKTISPQIESLTSELLSMSRMFNSMNISSCNAAASLVEGMANKLSAAQYRSCETRYKAKGADYNAAREACQSSSKREEIEQEGVKNNSSLLPSEYNLVWHSLVKSGVSEDEAKIIMSVSGTIIAKKNPSNKDQIIITYKPPLLSDVQVGSMLDGREGGKILRYNCSGECLEPLAVEYTMTSKDGAVHKTANYIESIFDKIEEDRQSSANVFLSDGEKSFINKTSIPVFSLAEKFHAAYGLRGKNILIDEYGEAIAYSYIQGYLNSLLDAAGAAVDQLEYGQIDGTVIKDFKERVKHTKEIIKTKMGTIIEAYNSSRLAEQRLRSLENDLRNGKGVGVIF